MATSRGEVVKSMGSDAHEVYDGGGGGGGDIEESGGLGLPNIADRIEYSRLAASEPKEKFGSNEVPSNESVVGKVSAGTTMITLDKIGDVLRRNMGRLVTNLGQEVQQGAQSLQILHPESFQRL